MLIIPYKQSLLAMIFHDDSRQTLKIDSIGFRAKYVLATVLNSTRVNSIRQPDRETDKQEYKRPMA